MQTQARKNPACHKGIIFYQQNVHGLI